MHGGDLKHCKNCDAWYTDDCTNRAWWCEKCRRVDKDIKGMGYKFEWIPTFLVFLIVLLNNFK